MKTNKNKKKVKIGLALSGGGWRGLAHVGVLKVLEKYNIPIDLIAGSSAGALFGGLYSYYGNSKDLEEFIIKFGYRDLFKIIADPKLKSGLIKGRNMIKYLNKHTEKALIEDLKVPFTAVASDVLTAKSYYFKKGNLSEAIKTSASIPLLFQPTIKGDMVLIDGGATENVPVRCAKDMGADIVIAVSVNTAYFPLEKSQVKTSTNLAVASARTVLDRFSEILSNEADITIKPKISKKKVEVGISYFLEFVREKDIIKTGEKAAEDKIEEIMKVLNAQK